MTCDRCGQPIGVGDWPFCGGINTHGRPTLGVRPDSVPGGTIIRNLTPYPVRVDSSTEWRALMKKAGALQMDGNRFLTNAAI